MVKKLNPRCILPPATEAYIEHEKIIFGTAFVYACECGKNHCLPSERVTVLRRSSVRYAMVEHGINEFAHEISEERRRIMSELAMPSKVDL